MNVFVDIETLPAADKQPFIDEARNNFKAPSDLSKTQACADLGLTGNDEKFTSKEKAIALWEERFKDKKAPELAESNWRKTALDGTRGRILSIAYAVKDETPVIHINQPYNERDTLEAFFDTLSGALSKFNHGGGASPYFIGHNLTFDLKFIFRRAVILGIKPPFELNFKGYHGKDYFCTMQGWRERGERISLANLCSALSIESTNDIDGSMVCDMWLAGRMQEIAAYNVEDVELTRHVYRALNFLSAA